MKDSPSLQLQLVIELVGYGDLPLATRYARQYNVPPNTLPISLQLYMGSDTSDVGKRGYSPVASPTNTEKLAKHDYEMTLLILSLVKYLTIPSSCPPTGYFLLIMQRVSASARTYF